MYLIKKIKLLFIFAILFLNFQNLSALENKILFKVDNQIITTMDIFEEIKFLPDDERWLMMSEGRPCEMNWLVYEPRNPL